MNYAAAAAAKSLQSCPTLCDLNRQQPTSLLCPLDSLGTNTGVGCHFFLHYELCETVISLGLLEGLILCKSIPYVDCLCQVALAG